METAPQILIDGDLLVWTEAAAIEYTVRWETDVHTLVCDFAELKQRIDVKVIGLVEKFSAEKFTLAFSDPENNFRNKIYPDYKANRRMIRKPLSYKDAVAYCHDVWGAVTWPNLEADDVLGILATTHPTAVVVSRDKDTRTVPCLWHNPSSGEGIQTITLEEADAFHLHQTLTGDRADNYSGIPGCGPRGADKILGRTPTWAKVVDAYTAAGLTEEDALVNARCARICRKGEYTHSKGSVVPWLPKDI